MSLKPLQADKPLGQFDVKDADLANVKGGEVMTFATVTATAATDKAAYDAFDGYAAPANRAYATFATSTGQRPLMLTDDGITGYGTLFGSVVGGTVGQVSTGGTVLGPHSALGSGKVTLWALPGLYAVTTDAVDDVLPTNGSATPGAALSYTSAGKLTIGNAVAVGNVLGRLVEFSTTGSLVNTPNTLAGTFNPPDGALATTSKSPTLAIIWFAPPAGLNAS